MNRVVRRGVPYADAEAAMVAALDAAVAGDGPDTLLLVEPEPVFTLGRRRGAADNVLAAGEIPVVPAARGGDVTFHGPGQIVAWPVVSLPPDRRDLHLWMHGLEHVVIEVLGDLGLAAGRDARNTGVWLDGRKVCAVGIGCRRWVTWHGLALNLTTDLAAFRRINPCGLGQDTVTRLADHLDVVPDWADLAQALADRLDAWWQGPDPRAEVQASLARFPPR
ncbi:MAG: lipoyl(octanoyl) transferase LipB [Alphaproteobacteria bacterium]|nr:lipoyl(octanoyl) transferase LipB [Alphaproteobacteria bacterium]